MNGIVEAVRACASVFGSMSLAQLNSRSVIFSMVLVFSVLSFCVRWMLCRRSPPSLIGRGGEPAVGALTSLLLQRKQGIKKAPNLGSRGLGELTKS